MVGEIPRYMRSRERWERRHVRTCANVWLRVSRRLDKEGRGDRVVRSTDACHMDEATDASVFTVG